MPPALPSVPWSLTVIRPSSTAFLDSNRIAVRPEPNVLQVYKGANWSDSLPDLVQAGVVQAFENSGKIKSVSRQNSGVPAEVALLLDIRQFESIYADGVKIPSAVIQIHAKVLEYPSNRVIAAKNLRRQCAVDQQGNPRCGAGFRKRPEHRHCRHCRLDIGQRTQQSQMTGNVAACQ